MTILRKSHSHASQCKAPYHQTGDKNNVPNNRDRETVLVQYINQIQNFKDEIAKVQCKIETLQEEVTQKKHCIQTCVEDSKSNEIAIINHINTLGKLNASVINNCKALRDQEECSKAKIRFSEVSQKYELAKLEIQKRKQEENILNTKLADNLTSQLLVNNKKCASMEEDEYYKHVVYAEKQEENNTYKLEIAKLKLKVKRLEIKATSLERFLEKKSEECVALAELNDEIARQPI